MMLVEQTQVPVAALPVAQFKDHLRLGTGFSDEGIQDGVLETYLRAAVAAIEARTGKALIERDYSYTVGAWRDLGAQVLPIAPVSAITAVTIIDRFGQSTGIASGKFMLEEDMQAPRLVSTGFVLPSIPVGGKARIDFTAGFGATWAELPADIAHAVMLLAAHYYEHRHETSVGEATMPFGVSSLLERYRVIRLFGGRAQ